MDSPCNSIDCRAGEHSEFQITENGQQIGRTNSENSETRVSIILPVTVGARLWHVYGKAFFGANKSLVWKICGCPYCLPYCTFL